MLSPASALERLYATHRDSVVRYLRATTRSEDDAFELAAVVFERAFGELRRRPDLELGLPWLLRTARNAAIDLSRRRRVRELAGRVLRPASSIDSGPEARYLARERAARLRAALQTLPAATRDAIALRYGLGLSAREIGDVIGRGEAATQKLISRGLARLREALDEPG